MEAPAGKRLTILFVITKSNWGGAQRYVFDLATGLKDRHHTSVALGGTGAAGAAPGTLATHLTAAGVATHPIASFTRDVSFRGEVAALRELRALLGRERPDVIHLNSSKAGGLGALASWLAGCRAIVFTVHGFPFHEPRPWVVRLLIRLATWLTLLMVTDVVCICERDARAARRLPCIARKVRLIPNGIDPVPAPAAPRNTLIDHTPALAAHAHKVWVATGTELTANKNIGLALRAFAALPKTARQNAHLLVCGTGELGDALEALAYDLDLADQVTFTGFVPDLGSLMGAFDLWLLVSHKEGLPYSILEASTAGTAVLASNVGGIPDLVPDPAHLVRPTEINEVRDALAALISDSALRQQCAAQQHAHVRTHFTRERMIAETEALYRATKSD